MGLVSCVAKESCGDADSPRDAARRPADMGDAGCCGSQRDGTPRGWQQTQVANELFMRKYRVRGGQRDLVGEGAFSICYSARDVEDGSAVAVKVYKVSGSLNFIILDKLKREVSILQHLAAQLAVPSDPTLWDPALAEIQPSDVFVLMHDFSKGDDGEPGADATNGEMYTVMELAEQSLEAHLAQRRRLNNPLSQEAVRSMARQLLLSLAALHSKGLVHLDLKPANIFLCRGRPKLADVGGCAQLGSLVSRNQTCVAFSIMYCSPEWARFLVGRDATIAAIPALDAWSVGLTLCQLATLDPVQARVLKGVRPRRGPYPHDVWKLIAMQSRHPVPIEVQQFDTELFDLAAYCLLAPHTAERWSPAQCLAEPYITRPFQ